MMTRRSTPISVLLALILFCLMPLSLHAHTHRPASHARAKSHPAKSSRASATASPRAHSRKASVAASPHSRHTRQVKQRKASNRRSRVSTVAAQRARVPHSTTRSLRHVVARQPHPEAIPAPLAREMQAAPEVKETGVSHPPDFDDQGPLTSPDVPREASNIAPHSSTQPPPEVRDEAVSAEAQPTLYNKHGRLVVPPPMRGTREILIHQNEVAERDGLERIESNSELEQMRREGSLVALPVNAGIRIDERLPINRRYSRPWTAKFLTTLARAHYARFGTPLQINSAVRTVEFQQRLIRTNGNAAPARGETASPHLTGQAVDIAKRGLSLTEIAWMRGYLLPLMQEGKIDVEEEFQQACFHISVYRKYIPPASTPRRSIAARHHDSPASLAVAIP